MSTKVTGSAKAQMESMAASYMSDEEMLLMMMQKLEWERYKSNLVSDILWSSGKQRLLVGYTHHRLARNLRKAPWKSSFNSEKAERGGKGWNLLMSGH